MVTVVNASLSGGVSIIPCRACLSSLSAYCTSAITPNRNNVTLSNDASSNDVAATAMKFSPYVLFDDGVDFVYKNISKI
ncbi:hypothetical protein DERP_009909 [Dermatophagoides pteronyssinus]|uniref:Uncharacterized protein n=1 Tax=Dermatophagoides pteronyssinus TaxID=6956 RepID=A0ABQ8J274_DERPT|nr:hypothetical protein DERP_009909 [Dermatophagoides pteronyssinus]